MYRHPRFLVTSFQLLSFFIPYVLRLTARLHFLPFIHCFFFPSFTVPSCPPLLQLVSLFHPQLHHLPPFLAPPRSPSLPFIPSPSHSLLSISALSRLPLFSSHPIALFFPSSPPFFTLILFLAKSSCHTCPLPRM